MSKKIKNSNVKNLAASTSSIALLEETVIEATETTPVVEAPVTEATPASNLAPRFAVIGNRDAMGFGESTETSWLIKNIRSASFTKVALQAAFLARFVPGNEPAEIKRKKTSFSVFFSDIKRSIGTYHASRSLSILVNEESGILSFNDSMFEAVEAAIAAGLLNDIRGLNPKKHPAKLAAKLSSYGLPTA